jgi:hypothetical protein
MNKWIAIVLAMVWLSLGAPMGSSTTAGEYYTAGPSCSGSTSHRARQRGPDRNYREDTNQPAPAVPEPSGVLLFGVGVLLTAGYLRQRKNR